MLIGYGSKTAGGCTSGNGLSGTSMLSPASIVATATFFATADRRQLRHRGGDLDGHPRWPVVLVGVVFGVTLSWTGMSSPEVLREALLLDNAYLYLFFASAVATSTLGLRCCAAPARAPC